MRRLAISATLAALPGACGPTQSRGATIARTAGAAGVVAGGATAAVAIHDRSGSDIALQVGGGTVAGLIPAALLDSSLDRDDSSGAGTPGEIYSGLGSGLGKAFLTSFTVLVPSFVTWKIGESQEESASPGRAFLGATLGAAGGMMLTGLLVDRRLPQWARIAISASLMGSLSTLGYQLGGGGRP